MSRNLFPYILILILSTSLCGCAQPKAVYSPPAYESQSLQPSVIVDRPLDLAWKGMVQYIAGTSFTIESIEKKSRLIILSFGTGQESEFITGGEWELRSAEADFFGDYVDYVTRYHNGRLKGKMNITMSEFGLNRTKVTFKARYRFSSMAFMSNRRPVEQLWIFNTGECASLTPDNSASGIPSKRTICPTGRAESTIMRALNPL
ncbi:MAG: hypothetical protein JRE14_11780 [Deltaproteobacteria bacterium]|nr:hypothetical protein [Deltaproteobacteria bacterium]